MRVSGTEISTQHSFRLLHFCNRFIELKLQVCYQKRNMSVLTFLLPSLRRWYTPAALLSHMRFPLLSVDSSNCHHFPYFLACSALCSHLSAESWQATNERAELGWGPFTTTWVLCNYRFQIYFTEAKR